MARGKLSEKNNISLLPRGADLEEGVFGAQLPDEAGLGILVHQHVVGDVLGAAGVL